MKYINKIVGHLKVLKINQKIKFLYLSLFKNKIFYY